MRPSHAVLLLILAGTLVRLILAATTGLGIDESYMAGTARTLALGYFDHPPLHVWIAWAAERLFGEAPIAVRLPFILLFAGSTWLMFRLTARLFGEYAGLWAALALTLAPVFSLADGSWLLPDGPMVFFLLASALAVSRVVLDEGGARLISWWVAAGLFAGLALLSKFNAAFFPLAVLVFLVTVPEARRHLATPGPWLAAVIAAVVVSPALFWNLQHGWAGVTFQAGRMHGGGLHFDRIAVEIGGELAYLTPWLAVPLVLSLMRALRTGVRDPRAWLLALAAIGPIVVFTLATLWSAGLPHWAMPGWLFAFPLFGRDAADLAARRPRFARGYMGTVAVVFGVLIVAFGVQAATGALIPAAVIAANPHIDPTTDLVDWRDLGPALQKQGLLNPEIPIAGFNWAVAGKASYALGPDVPVLCLCGDPHGFRYRSNPAAWGGRDVVLVAPKGSNWAPAERYFSGLQPLDDVTIRRGGQPAVVLELKIGRNLRLPPR
jgi:4-amino-4-deoxy-L-arabinose transferase-like glycosyltransferase